MIALIWRWIDERQVVIGLDSVDLRSSLRSRSYFAESHHLTVEFGDIGFNLSSDFTYNRT